MDEIINKKYENKNKMKKPNFFIVGEPKCGTTSMHEYLKEHPQIFMTDTKETGFFAKDIQKEFVKFNGENPKFYNDSDYYDLYSAVSNEKIVGESSTNYLVSKVAAKNIFDFNPNAKIIVMYREPVSLLISYNEYAQSTMQENVNLLEGLKLEPERKKWRLLPNHHFLRVPSSLYYSDRVSFTEHLERFLEYFPKKQIHIIFLKELRSNPKRVYRETLKFLEVENSFTLDFNIYNKKSNKRYRLLFIKTLASKGYFKYFRKILPIAIYKRGYKLFKLFTSKKIKEKKICLNEKILLKKRFKPNVIKLNQLLHDNNFIKKNLDLIDFWEYNKL